MNYTYIILILGTLLTVIALSYLLRRILGYFIHRSSRDLNADPTKFIYIKNSISFLLCTAGILFIFHKIPYFNSLGSALFAGAGVLAAIIGFASQKAFANIIGGLFILMFKPFKVGDIIELSSSRRGMVEEITLRHTVIKDFESRRVVIPNSQISEETIVNSSITDEKIRKFIEIDIAYDADMDIAISIMRDYLESHPLCLDNRDAEAIEKGLAKVEVRVIGLMDSSVRLRAYAWASDVENAFTLSTDAYYNIKKLFDQSGIEIPFPHRTLVYKNQMNKGNMSS